MCRPGVGQGCAAGTEDLWPGHGEWAWGRQQERKQRVKMPGGGHWADRAVPHPSGAWPLYPAGPSNSAHFVGGEREKKKKRTGYYQFLMAHSIKFQGTE